MSLLRAITFKKVETLAIILFSVYALLQGEITVFYMLYLFWWQTVIHVIVNIGRILFFKKNIKYKSIAKHYISSNLFLLFLYFIFIIIFFGFILNFGNHKLLGINFQILFFMNWGFNLNILIFLVSALFFVKPDMKKILKNPSGFSSRNIILHISIILGAFIHFLIVLKFPKIFTEENLWGYVIVITPFILLRTVIDYYETK